MRITRNHVIGGLALATAAAAAAGTAATTVWRRRWHSLPDPRRDDDLSEPPGTIHHSVGARDGGQIHVVERGQGRPFLLLHGVTNSVAIWNYQLRDLVAAGYRVVAMDVRGHGQSHSGRDGHTLEAMADDAYEVVRELDLHDTVAVGHSMGGMILLQLVADHPELLDDGVVSAIALVSTSASPVLGGGLPVAAARILRSLTPAVAQGHVRASTGRAASGSPPGDWATLYTRLAFGSHPSPTHVEWVRAMTSAVPAGILGELAQTLLSLDVRQALGSIRQPALIVVGSRDPITPIWHSRYLARHIPVSELHVLPGCGHVVPLERPEELARLLVDFARRAQPVPVSVPGEPSPGASAASTGGPAASTGASSGRSSTEGASPGASSGGSSTEGASPGASAASTGGPSPGARA
jgi:pimeloyl-ACP methyl ester carboxylesterase